MLALRASVVVTFGVGIGAAAGNIKLAYESGQFGKAVVVLAIAIVLGVLLADEVSR